MSNVTVLLFGPLAEIADAARLSFPVPEGARVADVLALVRGRFPALGARLDTVAVAVNLSYAGRDAALRPGDEVALIPPVSGG